MDLTKIIKAFLGVILIFSLSASVFAQDDANTKEDPLELLSLIDRPTYSFSAWTVPENKVVLETGYQYLQDRPSGHSQNFPEAELRIGLPHQTEITAFLPNYIVNNPSGYTESYFAIKHELVHTKTTLFTLQGMVNPPSGSVANGSAGSGGILNAISSYNFNPNLNLTAMLGISTSTLAKSEGGGRYNSVNPDVVLTLTRGTIDYYAEVYGQTKTAPNEGSGFNADVGIILLVCKNFAIDAEVGHRLTGDLDGYNSYIGGGASFEFG